MKFRPVRLTHILLPAMFSVHGLAQEDPAAAEPTVGIDEVVVVQGWRHPVQLRLQMVEAELAVYDLFNQLTKDDSLRLECSRRNIGGTRLQGTDCTPRFERDALQQESQDQLEMTRAYLNSSAITSGNFSAMFPGAQNMQDAQGSAATNAFMSYAPNTGSTPAIQTIRAGQQRLKREMDRLAAEHPEFMEQVVKYVEAKTRYTEGVRRDE